MAIEWDATADRPAGSGWQQRPLRLPACIAVAVFVIGLFIATTVIAQDSNQTRLIELDNAISAIEQWVSETRQQRSAEERELDRLGAETRDLSQLIAQNQQQLASLTVSCALWSHSAVSCCSAVTLSASRLPRHCAPPTKQAVTASLNFC